MPARHISTLLGASGELKPVAQLAHRLAELQQVLLEAAPTELAQASRVKSLRAGTLFLWTDNSATAAKLRQLAPRLLTAFQKQVAEIKGIRVEVQVKTPQNRTVGSIKKTTLPIEIIELFSELAERTRDPGLRSALTNFGRRKRGPG